MSGTGTARVRSRLTTTSVPSRPPDLRLASFKLLSLVSFYCVLPLVSDETKSVDRRRAPIVGGGSAFDQMAGSRARRSSTAGRCRSSGELLLFGAAAERGGGRGAGRHGVLHGIGPGGADERLVAGGAEAVPLVLELLLLQLRVGQHAALAIGAAQAEHARVQGVPARQRDELEPVAEREQLLAEALHGRVVEVRLPVERGRAVVSEHAVRVLGVDG